MSTLVLRLTPVHTGAIPSRGYRAEAEIAFRGQSVRPSCQFERPILITAVVDDVGPREAFVPADSIAML